MLIHIQTKLDLQVLTSEEVRIQGKGSDAHNLDLN